jgi:hypothetical protein
MLSHVFRNALVRCGVLLVSTLIVATNVHATYTITMTESAGDVVAVGSGSLNTTDLSLNILSPINRLAYVVPNDAAVVAGPSSFRQVDIYETVNGPTSVGTGAVLVQANSGSGDLVGISEGDSLFVPTGYVSGNPLSGTATWTGTTFAGLGLTPGTYTWTWGSGPNADSFVLQVGPAPASSPQSIPTLSEWAMIMMAALMAIGAMRYRKR